MIDLISIGDVTEDVFLQLENPAEVICRHDHQCSLCMPFGTKIAVRRVDKLLGGNGGNVAIGAARLGLRSALYAEAGADSQGQLVYEDLKKNNVSTKYFTRKKGAKTNYSVVLNFTEERTILVHHEPRTYHLPAFDSAKWVYLTSMAKGSEKIFPALSRYLIKNNVNLAFNPGTHQLHLGLAKLKPMLQLTSILFVNTEEAQLLLGTAKRDFLFLLRTLHAAGPKIVVITDGDQGSYCYNGQEMWSCPIYRVPVVERTGCGDAFATGFLCALFYGQSIHDALRWGTFNSAFVLQYIGPQEGLLTKKKMFALLQAHSKLKARKLTKKNNIFSG